MWVSACANRAGAEAAWDTVLQHTQSAFEILRQALQFMGDGGASDEHIHGAVRILTSILRIQLVSTAFAGLEDCQAHLSASIALFRLLIEAAGDQTDPVGVFDHVIRRLGPETSICATVVVPSCEQAAFRFSAGVVLADDIIASTALREEPRLYHLHESLLQCEDPRVNLAEVVGCHTWVLPLIADIAALDVWKKRRREAATLDMMEVVHRAETIKHAVNAGLDSLQHAESSQSAAKTPFGLLTTGDERQIAALEADKLVVTRIWAEATLLYLFVAVSGWQVANGEVCSRVERLLELVEYLRPAPAALRAIVWPLCVGGCLADITREARYEELLEPLSAFGTVKRALQTMRRIWSCRDVPGDAAQRDLAMCFSSQGEFVLLV